MRKSAVVALILFTFIISAHEKAFSMERYGYYSRARYLDDDEIVAVNRPASIQGLTGLLFTNSAYTQPAGGFLFGLSAIGENSDIPDYSVVQGAASLTVGLSDTVEVGVKAKMVGTNLGSSSNHKIGAGDTDVLIKWRFSSQGETMPALALGFGLTLPTGDKTKGLTEVRYEGIKVMALASSEKRVLDNGFIGMYLEAQAVFNDQLNTGSTPYKEKYGVFNAGLLFPINEDHRMQFLLEYNRVFKKDIVTLYDETSSTGFTPALRYVREDFNVTIGAQHVSRDNTSPAYAKTDWRLAGTISYRF